MKRISFDLTQVQHLYELALEHFQVPKDAECYVCDLIKKRLEKFLGRKEIAESKRVIRKSPYCKGADDWNRI